ncbi:hypothetical protein K2173_024009 [Erythroxylum novogranatense]|uniref:Uncharacterized protein n=1 Tax=Erythroxylum novogranatense TaxID=1862640 RepID=A0AAV8TSF6_9ROSI|nr:hypothetical protein K2173_024009 [Erythroxylum novogranatense]
MAWRSGGSVTRSVISAARSSPLRSSPPLPRIRPPTSVAPGRPSCRFSLAPTRTFGELGCVQSLLPLHGMSASAHLTSHFNSNLRAFCELSHGTFRRSCQDR